MKRPQDHFQRIMWRRPFARLQAWAQTIKTDVIALWLAGRDDLVPLRVKIVAALVAAYALSPIDLIPDFVPILGYLDDLIILPIGIALAIKLIPAPVMRDLRLKALALPKPISRAGAAAVVCLWLAGAGLAGYVLLAVI